MDDRHGAASGDLEPAELALWQQARQLDADAIQHHHRAAVREARADRSSGPDREDYLAAASLERQLGDQAADRAKLIRETLGR